MQGIADPIKISWARYADRGYRKDFKPDTLKGETELRTQKELYSDVEKLYIGPDINANKVYASFFVTFFSVLCFSAGMPMLYLIAAVNFWIIFIVYKILLVKYYKKTTSFNQVSTI